MRIIQSSDLTEGALVRSDTGEMIQVGVIPPFAAELLVIIITTY